MAFSSLHALSWRGHTGINLHAAFLWPSERIFNTHPFFLSVQKLNKGFKNKIQLKEPRTEKETRTRWGEARRGGTARERAGAAPPQRLAPCPAGWGKATGKVRGGGVLPARAGCLPPPPPPPPWCPGSASPSPRERGGPRSSSRAAPAPALALPGAILGPAAGRGRCSEWVLWAAPCGCPSSCPNIASASGDATFKLNTSLRMPLRGTVGQVAAGVKQQASAGPMQARRFTLAKDLDLFQNNLQTIVSGKWFRDWTIFFFFH